MTPKETAFAITAGTIIKNLEIRNIEGYYCVDREDLMKQLLPMLKEGTSIAWGGSETLKETRLLEQLKKGNYELIDRLKAVTPEEKRAIAGKTAMCDYYFMSTNAITTDGELINIDGIGNRIASLIHGPSQVFVIAGKNKVAGDIGSGLSRIHTVASPANAVRLDRKTPCAATGRCNDCFSPDCMCSSIVITRRSGIPGRIKVFLVGEELGY